MVSHEASFLHRGEKQLRSSFSMWCKPLSSLEFLDYLIQQGFSSHQGPTLDMRDSSGEKNGHESGTCSHDFKSDFFTEEIFFGKMKY